MLHTVVANKQKLNETTQYTGHNLLVKLNSQKLLNIL